MTSGLRRNTVIPIAELDHTVRTVDYTAAERTASMPMEAVKDRLPGNPFCKTSRAVTPFSSRRIIIVRGQAGADERKRLDKLMVFNAQD